MTNRTLNVGDIVLDKRYNIYEIIEEINYDQDLIVVRGMFDSGDRYNYGFKAFYYYYDMISSVGD
jgi:hypothetical protein